MNQLYLGDNLPVLRNSLADQSVDLVYLDPPFNSNTNYDFVCRPVVKHGRPGARVPAFADTWRWTEQSI